MRSVNSRAILWGFWHPRGPNRARWPIWIKTRRSPSIVVSFNRPGESRPTVALAPSSYDMEYLVGVILSIAVAGSAAHRHGQGPRLLPDAADRHRLILSTVCRDGRRWTPA